jgi:hypothetical protein
VEIRNLLLGLLEEQEIIQLVEDDETGGFKIQANFKSTFEYGIVSNFSEILSRNFLHAISSSIGETTK